MALERGCRGGTRQAHLSHDSCSRDDLYETFTSHIEPAGDHLTDDAAQMPEDIDPLEPLMTVNEVAAMLNVRKQWVYEAASRKAIPSIKVGHFLRFRRSDLLAWLDANASAAEGVGDRRYPHYVPLRPSPHRG